MTSDRMDQQCFGIVRTIGISQPNRFRWLGCPGSLLSEFSSIGRESRFRHAINDDILARITVVADVADVEIRRGALWSRSDGDVFPIAILGSSNVEDSQRITATIEAVDDWTTTGVVVGPVRARGLARCDESTALGDRSLFNSGDGYRWAIRCGRCR